MWKARGAIATVILLASARAGAVDRLCLMHEAVCKDRDAIAYRLYTLYESTSKACGRKIPLSIDWGAFERVLKSGESASGCLAPIEEINRACEQDPESAKAIQKKLSSVRCKPATGGAASFILQEGVGVLEAAPQAQEGGSQNAALLAGIKAAFQRSVGVTIQTEEDRREQKRKERQAEREQEQAKRQRESEAQAAKIRKDVEESNQKARRKGEIYKEKVARIMAEYQTGMKKLQSEGGDPAARGKKMQDLAAKMQADLEVAQKEYNREEGKP